VGGYLVDVPACCSEQLQQLSAVQRDHRPLNQPRPVRLRSKGKQKRGGGDGRKGSRPRQWGEKEFSLALCGVSVVSEVRGMSLDDTKNGMGCPP
jgi:hypothetical protein